MTKSKTIIATLGIVAGLGAAALPLASYAADARVSGDVKLAVEVEPAISMTIAGNNDDNSKYAAAGATTGGITVYSDIEGNTTGYIDGTQYTSTATATNAETAANSGIFETTTTALSSSYATLLPNSSFHGSDSNGFKSTISVWTNDPSGYTLGISDIDNLLHTDGSTPIAKGDGKVKAGTQAWGYAVDTPVTTDYTSGDALYQSADNSNIKQTSAATDGTASVTTVYYGVSTANDQKVGVYTDTITYTATTRQ